MDLLAAYDAQVRTSLARRPPKGVTCDWDGPLLRCTDLRYRGFVGYRSLAGVDDVDALIARTVAFFAARGEAFEWKAHGHDQPADLPDRLRAHGFVPEDVETVMIGETALMAREPVLPTGVVLREVSHRDEFRRIAGMESEVWGADWSWLADDLASRDPTVLTVLIAEAGDSVVSAAWLVYEPGTEFAGLWGGSTCRAGVDAVSTARSWPAARNPPRSAG
jgi:hypothetical protein